MNTELIGKLKRSFVVRTILCPVMTVKKYINYYQYQKTECHNLIKQNKDIHKGERCFIIGNGPSLKASDLELIKGEISFATNDIFQIFDSTTWRPTYYLACDVEGIPDLVPYISKYDGLCFLSNKASSMFEERPKNVLYSFMTNLNFPINTYNDKSSHISEDVSCYFSRGYTVTFDAIQLAIYMGCKEIYLLGVDFSYALKADKYGRIKRVEGTETSYFHETSLTTTAFLNYYSTLYAYEAAEKYCKEHDIVIKNATRGGKLEVFERVNLDDLIRKM